MTYPLQFAAGALINTAGSGNDFVGGTNGYGNVRVQWPAFALKRLHRGRPGDKRSAHEPEQRAFDEPGAGLELDRGGYGQYALLRCRSGTIRGFAGQLCNQIGDEPVSRQSVRALERLAIQCRELLYEFHARQSQAEVHHQPFRRQSRRPDSARQIVLLLRYRMGSDCPAHRLDGDGAERPRFNNMCWDSFRWEERTRSPDRAYPPAPQLVPFYRNLFSLYQSTTGTPLAVLGCPFNSDGSPAPGAPAERKRLRQSADCLALEQRSEQVQTARIDYNINEKNAAWFRFQNDSGLQAAYTDADQSLVQRDFSSAALFVRRRLHACLLAEPGELLQSGVLLV